MEFLEDFHFDLEDNDLQLTQPILEEKPAEIFKEKTVDRLIDEFRSQMECSKITEETKIFETEIFEDVENKKKKKSSHINQTEKYEFKNVITEYLNVDSFMDLKLSKPILKVLTDANINKPTPIQEACIPIGLMNKDICACAKTGSGKTLAFLIPIVEKLIRSPQQQGRYVVPRAVVLSPTRELALQIYEVAKTLIKFCPKLSTQLVSGGLNRGKQEASLRNGADIIIATPGRLIDIIHNTPNFDLLKIEFFVLDEADKMLDEYFIEQIKEVLKGCSPTKQVMLFSATMTENVKDLIALSLNDPFKIFVNKSNEIPDALKQEIIRIPPNSSGVRESMLAALICQSFSKRTIVFVPTKHQCHRIHILLGLLGVKCAELHGDMTQAQRLDALGRFARAEDDKFKVDVLVGTDLAARGLDVEDIETVINYSLPDTYERYVHRVGRTARNQKSGRAISLAGKDDKKLLKMICKGSVNEVKVIKINEEIEKFYKEKTKSLESTINKIIKTERIEKETEIAELELEKAKNKIEKQEEEKIKRFNWFSNRDAKGMKIKRKRADDGDANNSQSDDDDDNKEPLRKKGKKENFKKNKDTNKMDEMKTKGFASKKKQKEFQKKNQFARKKETINQKSSITKQNHQQINLNSHL